MKLHQLKTHKKCHPLFLSSVSYSTSRLLDYSTTLSYSCHSWLLFFPSKTRPKTDRPQSSTHLALSSETKTRPKPDQPMIFSFVPFVSFVVQRPKPSQNRTTQPPSTQRIPISLPAPGCGHYQPQTDGEPTSPAPAGGQFSVFSTIFRKRATCSRP